MMGTFQLLRRSLIGVGACMTIGVVQLSAQSFEQRLRSAEAQIDTLRAVIQQLSDGIQIDLLRASMLGSNAVVAFSGPCPAGWTEFGDASGRFIVGVNNTHALYSTGGASEHTLSQGELPDYTLVGTAETVEHSHDMTVVFSVRDGDLTSRNPKAGGGGVGAGENSFRATDSRMIIQPAEHAHSVSVGSGGQGQPHNNMPPYIALRFCKSAG